MSDPIVPRRRLLRAGAAAAGAFALGGRLPAAPRATVEQVSVVSQEPHVYHGWPTLTRRRSGELLLVCSGGREAHVCPFGRVVWTKSTDGGRSWTWPRTLRDSAIDDRDAGVLETSRGTILVTTFTSDAWEGSLTRAESRRDWPPEKLARWRSVRRRLGPEKRRALLGCWMLRSTDGGATWSAPYRTPVNSPHGPVELSGGRLLYAGKELWTETQRIGVATSDDDGESWKWLAEVPARPADDPRQYHELHAVETADGRVLLQIRNHNRANHHETLESVSTDGGKSWSVPRAIGVWGYPSHLLRLRDGRLLMTYGHRRKPLGVQARVSADHGRRWSDPLIVSADGTSSDLGYPSTVELDDGTLVTVWYEAMKDSPRAVLRQARWKNRP